VTNLLEDGSLANVGNLTATGNITLAAKGTLSQAAGTIFTAGTGKDVTLTSAAADIRQAADAGIEAVNVNVTSAKTVDLQGTGNKFKSIAVQASQADAPITGDVLVKTTTDGLNLSVQPAVVGNIAVENRYANGSIEVLSALQARDDDDTTVLKGNISLTAGADVNIHRDITTGQKMPAPYNTFTVANILADKYNSLTIKAGGVIQEAEGVKIDAPVVDTQSGKGVSLESSKNKFAIFLADGKNGGNEINGSVKAITNYDGTYVAGTRVDSIKGDADFTNLADPGSVRFLVDSTDSTDPKGLSVLGGNNAQTAPGSLWLAAGKDVELLGNVYAKNDIVLASLGEGSVYGLGKGMEAGNDVFMLAKDAVYYIGTMKAGNSIDVEVWHAASASAGSGIHIGTVASMLEQSQGETLLEAGKDMNFIVKGNGDVDLEGKLEAKAGTVTVDISGQGDISIGQKDEVNEKTITAKGDVTIGTGQGDIAIVKGIESTNESIKLETGKGNITVGRDNVSDEKSLIANKNVSIGTN
ncbi:MAG: hypothetical protein IIY91_04760, partial [Selenomonas sp.]|nr:hypothetical protein [Selenomonas sp.]